MNSHIHTHTNTYIHTHTYTYTCIHKYTYTYIHIFTHTHTCKHIHTYTCTHTQTNKRIVVYAVRGTCRKLVSGSGQRHQTNAWKGHWMCRSTILGIHAYSNSQSTTCYFFEIPCENWWFFCWRVCIMYDRQVKDLYYVWQTSEGSVLCITGEGSVLCMTDRWRICIMYNIQVKNLYYV